jgi:hypothetical protein
MIWHVLVTAAVWWSAGWSGCVPDLASAPVASSAPLASTAAPVPPDHWAYGALAELAAAGWEIPKPAAGDGTRTRAEFTTLVLQLVSAAAAREPLGGRARRGSGAGDSESGTGEGLPMPQRILLARLVAEFQAPVPAAEAARLPGLRPEEAPSPDGKRLARCVPTPSGAQIVLVEKATQQSYPIAVLGYNYCPVWSDDGDEVAWLSFAEGRTEVWVHSVLFDKEHLAGSALIDRWGTLTTVKDGFTLRLPGRPDRLIRIPALLEPENGGAAPPGPLP